MNVRSFLHLFIMMFFITTIHGMTLNRVLADQTCDDIADQITHGGVIWTQHAIVVQGTAAPNLSDPFKAVSEIKREAQRAATLDAFRKVAAILAGINITGDTFAADYPHVVAQVRSYIPQPEICKTKYYADGGVDVVVKVPLSGKLANALLPDAGSNPATAKSKFTGLIIDASDVPFRPAIAPRFLTRDGSVLFSQENVKRDMITQKGIVQYITDQKEANKGLVGSNPLTVRAIGLSALSPSDLILDANADQALSPLPAFMGDGKIAIIISPVQPITCRDSADRVKDYVIDWEKKRILARGFGKVDFSIHEDSAVRLRMMERAAEVDAQRRLLNLLLAIKIDGRKAVKDGFNGPGLVEGIVKQAVFCGAKYFQDGTAEVVLAAPLDGMLTKGANLGKNNESMRLVAADSKATGSNATGLIVDASDHDFRPVLAPRLILRDGTEIYGPQTASKAYVMHFGVVGYRSSLQEARSDERVGQHPLIVKAEGVGQDPDALILKTESVDGLNLSTDMAGPFNQGRVVIVTHRTIDYQ